MSLSTEEKIENLKERIVNADRIVFLSGAGVSTESGIPDFRSKDGLYNQHDVRFEDYSPEFLLSKRCLLEFPDVFFEFYRQKLDCRRVKPNITHRKLAELERSGKNLTIVTQNIDGLHQKAGSKNVIELHGSANRVYCTRCKKQYDSSAILDNTIPIPHCKCGAMLRPDITLYNESLPWGVYEKAEEAIEDCDLLIVAGTSLSVSPACNLVSFRNLHKTVIVNRDATEKDGCASLVIHSELGEVFSRI